MSKVTCFKCGVHTHSREAYIFSWKMIIVGGKDCDFCGDCVGTILSDYCRNIKKNWVK